MWCSDRIGRYYPFLPSPSTLSITSRPFYSLSTALYSILPLYMATMFLTACDSVSYSPSSCLSNSKFFFPFAHTYNYCNDTHHYCNISLHTTAYLCSLAQSYSPSMCLLFGSPTLSSPSLLPSPPYPPPFLPPSLTYLFFSFFFSPTLPPFLNPSLPPSLGTAPLLQGNCRTVFLTFLKDGESHRTQTRGTLTAFKGVTKIMSACHRLKVCVFVCLCVCVYVFLYVYIYISIYVPVCRNLILNILFLLMVFLFSSSSSSLCPPVVLKS